MINSLQFITQKSQELTNVLDGLFADRSEHVIDGLNRLKKKQIDGYINEAFCLQNYLKDNALRYDKRIGTLVTRVGNSDQFPGRYAKDNVFTSKRFLSTSRSSNPKDFYEILPGDSNPLTVVKFELPHTGADISDI